VTVDAQEFSDHPAFVFQVSFNASLSPRTGVEATTLFRAKRHIGLATNCKTKQKLITEKSAPKFVIASQTNLKRHVKMFSTTFNVSVAV